MGPLHDRGNPCHPVVRSRADALRIRRSDDRVTTFTARTRGFSHARGRINGLTLDHITLCAPMRVFAHLQTAPNEIER